MKYLCAVITAVALAFSVCTCAFASDNDAGLRFRDDGSFRILHLTDTQDDENTARELVPFLEKAVSSAAPDLIVLTGDIVEDSRPVADLFTDKEPFFDGVVVKRGGKLDYDATLANVKSVCAEVFGVFERAGIPFVIAQGNNDYKAQISNEDWLKIYAGYPHCLNAFDLSDDKDGHLDSYIEILSSAAGKPAYGVYLLDNGRSFTEDQAEWLTGFADPELPSLAFAHVPVSETGHLFEKCSVTDAGAFLSGGKVMRLDPESSRGHAETRYDAGESLMFKAMKSAGVKGAFFGHTHVDGYTGIYDGMMLGVTYGCEFSKTSPYGMRTITVYENEPDRIDTDVYVYTGGSFRLQTVNDFDEPSAGSNPVVKALNLMRFLFRHILYRINLFSGKV